MISMIVAMDEHHLIGKNNTMPWYHQDDLKWFKQRTLHHKILMGSKTYKSLGKPLFDRYTYVLSRNKDLLIDSSITCVIHEVEPLLNLYKSCDEELIICGGKAIYERCIHDVDKLYISLIPGQYEGDTYLYIDLSKFKCILMEQRENFSIMHYRRMID